MKVILAIDTVATTKLLMSAVESRLWPRGTQVSVLSVVEDDPVPPDVWLERGYTSDAVRQEMRRRGEQLTALTVKRFRELGIHAEVSILRGNPQALITSEARKWAADLIIIRAHNRRDLRNRMLGSVAKAVVRDATCSVEVVREVGEELKLIGNGHMKILLATDGSNQSAAAARAVAERPWPAGTEVLVMSMVNPLIYSIEEIGLFDGGGTECAHRAIGEAAQILKQAGVRSSGKVIAGKAERQIINEAREWGADLIVVGTEDRRGIMRLVAGSISEAVASRAPCSVRIVREDTSREH